MLQHYARICWNELAWTKPSGSAKDGSKTFFGQFGFGMEEWLFDPTAIIEGWQYGFLQPVNRGYNKRIGDLLSLRLYTIPGGGAAKYREEYELTACEVLTRAQAARETGMQGNQNTAWKLRDKFTMDKLRAHFKLQD